MLSVYFVITAIFAAFISFAWSSRFGINLFIKMTAFFLAIASAVLFLREQGWIVAG